MILTGRTFQSKGLCQVLIRHLLTSFKQLTKTSGSKCPGIGYHQQLCCCSSIGTSSMQLWLSTTLYRGFVVTGAHGLAQCVYACISSTGTVASGFLVLFAHCTLQSLTHVMKVLELRSPHVNSSSNYTMVCIVCFNL